MIHRLPVPQIFSDDIFNSRGKIPPVRVFALAKDIAQNGQIQPIVVQPWDKDGFKYRIICGHRRYMAHRINKSETIDAIIREGLSEDDAFLLNLSENLNREDLNILQEAKAIRRFINAGWKPEVIALKLSVNAQWVKVRSVLLDLEPEIQNRAEAGLLTQYQILDISKMPTVGDRMLATQKAVEHKLRGERGSLKLKKEKSVFTKKPRNIAEIHEMQDIICEALGNGLPTRLAAWCAGVISAKELYNDIKKSCEENGLEWEIPLVVSPPHGF